MHPRCTKYSCNRKWKCHYVYFGISRFYYKIKSHYVYRTPRQSVCRFCGRLENRQRPCVFGLCVFHPYIQLQTAPKYFEAVNILFLIFWRALLSRLIVKLWDGRMGGSNHSIISSLSTICLSPRPTGLFLVYPLFVWL